LQDNPLLFAGACCKAEASLQMHTHAHAHTYTQTRTHTLHTCLHVRSHNCTHPHTRETVLGRTHPLSVHNKAAAYVCPTIFIFWVGYRLLPSFRSDAPPPRGIFIAMLPYNLHCALQLPTHLHFTVIRKVTNTVTSNLCLTSSNLHALSRYQAVGGVAEYQVG